MSPTSATSVPEETSGDPRASGHRTAPDQETTAWPPGVPYIVGNEVCERFSYYGMKAILYAHLTILYGLAGIVEEQAKDAATSTVHLFNAGVYALPMIGAIIADRLAGKYRTILYLSLIYCAGHAVLACAESTLAGMYVGLGLIAVGSGGIKPCVSANVGDQFGKGNWFRVRTIFQIFYFSVNFGSFFSTLLIPFTRQRWGAGVAFAIPGILMFVATVIFWMGRKKFVHVPARPGGLLGLLDTFSSIFLFMTVGHLFFTAGMGAGVIVLVSAVSLAAGIYLFLLRQQLAPDNGFLAILFFSLKQFFAPRANGGREPPGDGTDESSPLARSRFWGPAVRRYGPEAAEGPVAVLKIITVFFLISVFWALFDQHGSSWIRQAALMDLSLWSGGEEMIIHLPLLDRAVTISGSVLPTQVPSLNPLMVMLLIPLMNVVYLGFDRLGIQTLPLRRITVGMFIASASFVAVALLQRWIDAEGPGRVWFAWQIIPYLLLTIAEVLVAVTALEFAYTQAPKAMKSTVMAFFNLTVAAGNVLVALLAHFGRLPLVDFFWVFAALMGAAGLLFGLRGYFYVHKDYSQ